MKMFINKKRLNKMKKNNFVNTLIQTASMFVGVIFMSSLLSGCSQTPKNTSAIKSDIAADFAITNVNIIPMDSERVLTNKTVLLKDNRIVKVIDANDDTFSTKQTIDGENKFLLPGLADMHSHLRMNPQAMFNQYLANGVTTVRNLRLADGKVDHVKLRQQIRDNEILAPRYLISGPQLSENNITNVETTQAMMDFHAEQKFDVVKVHTDLPPELYALIISEAKKHGIPVTGHAQHKMPLSETLKMGSVEHVEELLYASMHEAHVGEVNAEVFFRDHKHKLAEFEQASYRKDMAQQFIDTETTIVTTLTIFNTILDWLDDDRFAALQNRENNKYLPLKSKKKYLDSKLNPYRDPNWPLSFQDISNSSTLMNQLTKEFHQQGVQLILGVDAFGSVIPGFTIHKELSLLVDAGLTPYQALQTGTINVANYLGDKQDRGTIEQGKIADFFLVAKNPLESIANTKLVEGVYINGKWLSKPKLNTMLEEAEILNQK